MEILADTHSYIDIDVKKLQGSAEVNYTAYEKIYDQLKSKIKNYNPQASITGSGYPTKFSYMKYIGNHKLY
jgi:hypothetical protein